MLLHSGYLHRNWPVQIGFGALISCIPVSPLLFVSASD